MHIHVHLATLMSSWDDDLSDCIARAAQLGFDGVEVPILDPSQFPTKQVRESLTRHNLGVTCGTGLSADTNIGSSNKARQDAGREHLRRSIEISHELGAPTLGGVTYEPWGVPQDRLEDFSYDRMTSVLGDVAAYAEAADVTLCLELLNRYEGRILNTVAQGNRLLEHLAARSVKLHLDTFHSSLEELNVPSAIRAAGTNLGYVHCCENDRGLPGRGSVPWIEVFRALADVGYPGPVTVESFLRADTQIGDAVAIWRDSQNDSDESFRSCAAFLRAVQQPTGCDS